MIAPLCCYRYLLDKTKLLPCISLYQLAPQYQVRQAPRGNLLTYSLRFESLILTGVTQTRNVDRGDDLCVMRRIGDRRWRHNSRLVTSERGYILLLSTLTSFNHASQVDYKAQEGRVFSYRQ
jgi:hypothetical protein